MTHEYSDPHPRPVQKYARFAVLPLHDTLTMLRDSFEARHRRTQLGEFEVNVNSMRLRTFAFKGAVCACCGRSATHFALERDSGASESSRPHLNLWGLDDDGQEVLFTQDHVQPRSKGGRDTLENSQTMCSPCNAEKRDTWEPPVAQSAIAEPLSSAIPQITPITTAPLPRPLPSDAQLLARISSLEHLETYIYYDGPLLYSAKDAEGNLVLVYWYDRPEEHMDTWLVIPVTEQLLQDLVANKISLLAIITQPVVYALDIQYPEGPLRAMALDGGTLPPDSLPEPSVTLTEDFPPPTE